MKAERCGWPALELGESQMFCPVTNSRFLTKTKQKNYFGTKTEDVQIFCGKGENVENYRRRGKRVRNQGLEDSKQIEKVGREGRCRFS